MDGVDESIEKDFEFMELIGQGGFGSVYRARSKETGKIVAIKIVMAFENNYTATMALREVKCLQGLGSHPCIVQYFGIHFGDDFEKLYIVLEQLDMSLTTALDEKLPIDTKKVMHQLLSALVYVHSADIVHRDVKPANILVDAGKLNIRLADFGMARKFHKQERRPGNELSLDIGSLHYQAPEILLMSPFYGQAVDLWSCGAVLATLILKKPLFNGTNNVDQFIKISKSFPKDEKLAEYATGTAVDALEQAETNVTNLDELLSSAPNDLLELAKTLLVLDPNKRSSSADAIMHSSLNKFPRRLEVKAYVDLSGETLDFDTNNSLRIKMIM